VPEKQVWLLRTKQQHVLLLPRKQDPNPHNKDRYLTSQILAEGRLIICRPALRAKTMLWSESRSGAFLDGLPMSRCSPSAERKYDTLQRVLVLCDKASPSRWARLGQRGTGARDRKAASRASRIRGAGPLQSSLSVVGRPAADPHARGMCAMNVRSHLAPICREPGRASTTGGA